MTDKSGDRRVLHRSRGKTTRTIYHEPDPDNPDEPACHVTLQSDTPGGFRASTPNDLPDRYRLCDFCNPDVDVNTGGKTGTRLASRLLNDFSPDDVTGTSQRAHGGK